MIHRFIFQQIRNVFPYEPTDEQRRAIDRLSHFLSSPVSDDVFLLKGYAGTGKTSLLGATVKGGEGVFGICGTQCIDNPPENLSTENVLERVYRILISTQPASRYIVYYRRGIHDLER